MKITRGYMKVRGAAKRQSIKRICRRLRQISLGLCAFSREAVPLRPRILESPACRIVSYSGLKAATKMLGILVREISAGFCREKVPEGGN